MVFAYFLRTTRIRKSWMNSFWSCIEICFHDSAGVCPVVYEMLERLKREYHFGPRAGRRVYPNDPCPCGSGKKYKQCCGRYR